MIVAARERARAQALKTDPSTLRYAVLNIELRQEIHIAYLMNRPPHPFVQYCNIDRTLDPTDDWMWTWRMLAHTADILTYCNGGGSKSQERWRELVECLEVWEDAVPASFRPFYEEDRDEENGKTFPELLFANDCHGRHTSCR